MSGKPDRRSRAVLWLAVALLAGAACSSYVATSKEIRGLVHDGHYDQALAKLEQLEAGGSRLLYLYERGLILHQQNHYEESNQAFDQAEEVLDELYTRSISREAGALLVNENIREYRGDRFESALLHYYKIMNYLHLGELESAAVQCRRLDQRLDVLGEQPGSFFTDDPFLRYLSGMVYLENGDRNDADVSLRKALDLYRATDGASREDLPGRLLCDLAENAAGLGEREAARGYRQAGTCEPPRADGSAGTLRLFLECGDVAFKDENSVVIPIFENEIKDDMDCDAFAGVLADRYGKPTPSDVKVHYLLRVSMPVLVETPSGIRYARVGTSAPGDTTEGTYAVNGMDVAAMARRSFEEHQAALFLRAIARGLAKYIAKVKAEKEGGEAAGWAANILGVVTEVADTRSWSTLPEKILLAQLDLPEGSYAIHVGLFDRAGRLDDDFVIPDVEIRRGRDTLLNYRVY